jgi:ATP-binding cassette, subfamily B, bacterial MsbA
VTATETPAKLQASRALFGRFWRTYLRRHSPMMALAFIVMTIEGSTLAILAWALKPLFDRVFVGRDAGAIWWVGALIFGLFVIRALALIINRMLLTRISLATSSAIQTDLLRHILDLDGGFFQTHPPGALMDRVMGDTGAVQAIWSLASGATSSHLSRCSASPFRLIHGGPSPPSAVRRC